MSCLLTSTIDFALSLADDIIDLDQHSVVTHDATSSTIPVPSESGSRSAGQALSPETTAENEAEDEAIATLHLQEERISHAREHLKGTDRRVYGYYISQIGLAKFLLFLACCIGQVLGFYMPRTSQLCPCLLSDE